MGPSHPKYETKDYRNWLKILEWKLKKISITPQGKPDSTTRITELYQLAALVYLERISHNFSCAASQISEMVARGFGILSQLETCQWPFPLMIFACEAWTDEKRMMILELIAKTEREAHARSLDCLKNMIRIFWTQEDLAGKELDYVDKMSAMMSTSDSVPTFV